MRKTVLKKTLAASMAFAVVPTIAIGFSGPAAAEQASVRSGPGCDLTAPEPFTGPGASHGLVDAKAAWAWTQRSDTALSRLGALSRGEHGLFMGLQLDHRNRQVEVIYSRDLPQTEIDSLTKAADAAVAGALSVRLIPSCYTKGEVEEALGVLNTLAWDTDGPVLGSWSYRADDGRVEVRLPDDATAEAEQLKDKLGTGSRSSTCPHPASHVSPAGTPTTRPSVQERSS